MTLVTRILQAVLLLISRRSVSNGFVVPRSSWERGGASSESAASSIRRAPPRPPQRGEDLVIARRAFGRRREDVDICVVGGGVSGLTAALAAANETSSSSASSNDATKIVLLEASDGTGGRVASDEQNGFVLDRGFAVFIEEYPRARELLDYDELRLGAFLPGALVKLEGSDKLARVADPLRQPQDLGTALLAPVGSLLDKLELLPLIYHVRQRSVEELFQEPEADTLSHLLFRWGFSEVIIERFFAPFLEGIFLAPLEEQSSRMFEFIFKMFSEGAACLPAGGIGAVAKQLAQKAEDAGVDIRTGEAVNEIKKGRKGQKFLIRTETGKRLLCDKVIVATEGPVAQKLLAGVQDLEGIGEKPEQVQRSVACLYYSFDGEAPVTDPILILNGIGKKRGDKDHPVNNCCFPSVVSKSYAPEGQGLCSVTVLKDAMEIYQDRDDELDGAVRKQLSTWFPNFKDDILSKWVLQRIYRISNAQPAQLRGIMPANVHGGRDCTKYRGIDLPSGLYVCGDHMATATLNGALESGINAGKAAASLTPVPVSS